MEIFLRLKSGQVFWLTFGILMMLVTVQAFYQVMHWNFPLGDHVLLERIIALVSVGSTVVFSCWSWIVGLSLADKRKQDDQNEILFKLGLWVNVVFAFITDIVAPFLGFASAGIAIGMMIITIAFGLYCDYFIVKALNSVEKNRETSFGEFVGDFFGLVFYPIGIWWIQPRINKIFDETIAKTDPDAPLDQHLSI